MSALNPPVRPEYEVALAPLPAREAERPLPLATRVWQQAAVRRALILLVLAALWEALARWQDNDLLLPTFLQTARALVDGLASGELIDKTRISLVVLLQGYLGGVLAAFVLTALAVSTQLG